MDKVIMSVIFVIIAVVVGLIFKEEIALIVDSLMDSLATYITNNLFPVA